MDNAWFSEKDTLEKISTKIKKMQEQGLTNTDEYVKLIDDWETLSQNWIEGEILDDDPS